MSTLTNYLTGIADAIRIKKGTSATIPAQNFATEIKNLNTGGITPNGIINSYYAYAGENISAGDFVEFVNGVAHTTDYGNSSMTEFLTISDSSGTNCAIELEDGRIFFAYEGVNAKLNALIITIENGTVLVPGTNTVLSSGASSGVGEMTPILLSNNRVFLPHSYGTGSSGFQLYGALCDVSGATISVISDTKLIGTVRAGYFTHCAKVTEDTICIAHSKTSDYNLYAVVCKVDSDNTITIGSDLQLSTSASAGRYFTITAIDSSKVLIIGSLTAYVCSIDGTAISLITNTNILSSYSSSYFLGSTLLSKDKVLFVYQDSYKLSFIVLQLFGTNISVNKITKTTQSINNSTMNSAGISRTIPVIDGKVILAYEGVNSYVNVAVCTVSEDDTVTVESNTVIDTANTTHTGYIICTVPLQNSSLAVLYGCTTGSSTQGKKSGGIFVINGYEVSNHITIPVIEQQVKKSTSTPFNGIAKTSGVGGTSTEHNQQVSIYTL